MKKVLALLLVTLLLVPVLALCEAEPIKIGVFEPLTGTKAAGGMMEYEGIQVANSVVGEVLGRPIVLVPVDNKSDDVEAATAAARLVENTTSASVTWMISRARCWPTMPRTILGLKQQL